MNKSEINRAVSKYKKLLRSYPASSKNKKRRKAYLKISSLNGKKVFFDLFLEKISSGHYDINDQFRRLKIVPKLDKIFKRAKPYSDTNSHIYFNEEGYEIIIKKVKSPKGISLHLLTVYPK